MCAWWAHTRDEVDSNMKWMAVVLLLLAWGTFPPVLHYSLDSDIQHLAWFGIAGIFNAFVPWAHDRARRGLGDANAARSGSGIVSLLALVGVAFTAVAIQAGPCHDGLVY